MDPEKQKILDELVYVKKGMPAVLYREEVLDGEPVAVLYDAVQKDMYHLKGNSSAIWQLIDGTRTVREIAREVAEDCQDVDFDLVLKDVVRFITKIGRQGLIGYAYKQPVAEDGGTP